MKKVFFACMTVGLLATSCDWFNSKPKDDTTVVTPDDQGDSAIVTTNDSTVKKPDSAVAVTEEKIIETKKEVTK